MKNVPLRHGRLERPAGGFFILNDRGSNVSDGFDSLTPEAFLPVLESALECELTGYAAAFHSYINRVYEIRTTGEECLVVKFYRPLRWSAEAILEEHDYLWECADAGIAVVPPYELASGSTLGFWEDIPFAVFPKKRGRDASFESPEELKQAGTLVGRLHMTGGARRAEHRMILSPDSLIGSVVERLEAGEAFPHESLSRRFRELCGEIAEIASETFPAADTFLRLHGDLHRANLLNRPGEGLLLIDFDDMLNGPPVQDLWMLLPDAPSRCPEETAALLEGYSLFREFDESSFGVVESLRAMRMLYFLSWCAMQRSDLRFSETFPDWGTERFWRAEFADLARQIPAMREEIRFWSRPVWL